MKQSTPLAILGAGLSGLYAAYLLGQHNIPYVLFEGRPRLGGRILSLPTQGPHKLDMGPAWFWPEANPLMAQLVKQLGLQWYKQHTQGAALFQQADGQVRRLPNSYPQYPASCRLVGGMSSLVDALAACLDPNCIYLETKVRRLTFVGESVQIEVEQGGQTQAWQAQQVVCAIPPRLVASSVSFKPELPPNVLGQFQSVPTWMAGQAKIAFEFESAFWRQNGFSGDAFSQTGPLIEIHDASGAEGQPAALFGFVGGNASDRQRIGHTRLIEMAQQQIEALFGPQAATPLAIHYQEWGGDAFLSTAADLAATGEHPHYHRLGLDAPWNGKVVLAGTETSPVAGGYLEGALEAAQFACQQVLATR